MVRYACGHPLQNTFRGKILELGSGGLFDNKCLSLSVINPKIFEDFLEEYRGYITERDLFDVLIIAQLARLTKCKAKEENVKKMYYAIDFIINNNLENPLLIRSNKLGRESVVMCSDGYLNQFLNCSHTAKAAHIFY